MIRNTHRSIGKPLKGFGAYSIAIQCPLAGGDAVIKARAMYYLIDDSTTFDDRSICNAIGITLRQNNTNVKSITAQPKAKLFPNPTNESATLVYKTDNNCNAQFSITNLFGVQMFLSVLDSKQTSFSFSTKEMLQGVYLYKIKCNEQIIDNGKLVVIH